MKKALKFLSVILCLAMVFSMFTVLPISAEEEPVNLIKNPRFNLGNNGKVEGWALTSNNNSSYTVEENEDGYNTVIINSPTQDHYFNFGTENITKLNPNKYYKYSVWIKFDENSDGNYGYHSWGSTSLILKENTSARYRIAQADPTAALKGVWKEYSIIISGKDFYTQGSTRTEVSFYSSATRCKVYLKKPAIVEYNPDDISEVAPIETTNLITNSDFSQYDSTVDATTTDRFTGFKVDGKGTYALNHEQVTVNLNGSETTAAKITYQRQSANNAQSAYFSPEIDKTKNYRIGAWIKLTNADVYDEETQTWVDGTAWNTDGSVYLLVAKQNDQDENYRKILAVTETKSEWQYLSMTVSSEWISNTYDNKIRVGVRVYACALNVYVTGITIEEFVGDIDLVNSENVAVNGDFEEYDESNNKFNGWTPGYNVSSTDENAKYRITKSDGVSGNALTLIAMDNTSNITTYTNFKIDPSYDYEVTVYIKTGDASSSATFNNLNNNWNYLRIDAAADGVTVSSSDINKADGWQKISLLVSNLSETATTMKLTLNMHQVRGAATIDNVSVTPIIGGSISANRVNAKAGDLVYVKVNTDWGKRLAENGLTYLAKGATESVAITESKSEIYTNYKGDDGIERKVYTAVAPNNSNIYQFSMPEGVDITVSAVFEEIAALSGDADWNGEVNILDIIRIKKYLAGIEVNINLENAVLEDTTVDVDVLDLAALRKLILSL